MRINIHSQNLKSLLIAEAKRLDKSPTEIVNHLISNYFKDAAAAQENNNENNQSI